MLLGVYHPRLLLITTPSYTFNARFTAPDAPREARQGYPDPTGRTTRIFRHDDHKFEWTVQEFTEWCTNVANEWGYTVDVSGVGKPREKDEWGRDDELGFASQIAKFRRKEGDAWIRTRRTRAEQSGIWTRTATRQQQKAVAYYLHEAHTAAGKISTSEEIVECLKVKLNAWNIGSATIHELWFEEDVSGSCGGWLNIFLAVVESREEFELRRNGNRTLDWTLTWSGFVEKIEPKAEEEEGTDKIWSMDEDLHGTWGETSNSWGQGTYDEETQFGSNSQTSAWGKEYLGDNGSSSAWACERDWESKQEVVDNNADSRVWDRSPFGVNSHETAIRPRTITKMKIVGSTEDIVSVDEERGWGPTSSSAGERE
ncbi:hypothetical protein EIP86_002216 [Pleurotus ostreatoroseus]|nr:hypothetical protein EIP86_002216 [Pleurotus ostreatoroseus]